MQDDLYQLDAPQSSEKSEQAILENLNDSQKQAVSAPLQNMLVIAGAGTGKTRVLVSRISWLIKVSNILPRNILAVTFTNKAAGEMRQRIGAVVGEFLEKQLWANTFHSVCLRLLRSYAPQAGLRPGFTILDTDSQSSLIKRIMKELLPNFKELKPSEIASKISTLKENRYRAQDYIDRGRLLEKNYFDEISKIYAAYEQVCIQENSVDFSELLLRTVELLEKNEAIRNLQHSRFKEILVDEFQDPNALQYTFIRLMAGPDCHVTVVGDDDQSIYGWRGADYTNMKKFVKDFDNVQKIVLALNYRSSQNILDVANCLISENNDRMMEKVLKGTNGQGSKVTIYNCPSDLFETDTVSRCIESLHNKGEKYRDMAILYRNNYLSLGFEQKLTRFHIPYVMFGGQKFFERAEILDALSYLRVLVNEDDDTAALRVINVPARKIGPKVVENLRAICQERNCSVLKAITLLKTYVAEGGNQKELVSLYKKVQPFLEIVESLKAKRTELPLNEFVDLMLNVTGLYTFYQEKDAKEGKVDAENSRVSNLGALVSNVKDFVISYENRTLNEDSLLDDNQDPLLTYLSNITLASTAELKEDGSDENTADAVNMMTVHSSKGLEFKYVFLVGFEQDILPSKRALTSDKYMNEERRLAYVGVTRAKTKLYISYARQRSLFGKTNPAGASPFLREVVRTLSENETKPYEISNALAFYS